MPTVESRVRVPVDAATAFAVSQTTGATRLLWDPFIRRQHLLDGAIAPDVGVRTYTQHRLGWRMVSEYVSYRPPTTVGMRMIVGPRLFHTFAGGWRFTPITGRVAATAPAHTTDHAPATGGEHQATEATEAIWRYSFQCRPAVLAPALERIGAWLLDRDIARRIDAFARACVNPAVLAAIASPPDDDRR